MANEMIKPLVPLMIPFKTFPSIKSEKELISGTPGIKNNTDVANAGSAVVPKPSLTESPEMKEAVSAAK